MLSDLKQTVFGGSLSPHAIGVASGAGPGNRDMTRGRTMRRVLAAVAALAVLACAPVAGPAPQEGYCALRGRALTDHEFFVSVLRPEDQIWGAFRTPDQFIAASSGCCTLRRFPVWATPDEGDQENVVQHQLERLGNSRFVVAIGIRFTNERKEARQVQYWVDACGRMLRRISQ